jgi:uncharacterized protein (DUF1778 family)
MVRSMASAKRVRRRKRSVPHEDLVLSELDRAVFFDALVHPPKPNARLRRAFRSAERAVERRSR